VRARFVAAGDTAMLAVDKRGDGDGIVTSGRSGIDCGARCAATFAHGTTVTLTVRAADGSVFRGWSGGGCSGTEDCEVTLDGDRRVIARFALREIPPGTETLSVRRSGKGRGDVTSDPSGIDCGLTCKADFPKDAEVALTADAAEGSEFAGWSGGGCSGTDPCTVTLDGAQTVIARFEPAAPRTFTLTTHAAGDGSGAIRPDCPDGCVYDAGAPVRVIAKPTARSEFTGWSGDCSGTDNLCSLTMTKDQDVTATFDRRRGG
jgi:hypothetical protein